MNWEGEAGESELEGHPQLQSESEVSSFFLGKKKKIDNNISSLCHYLLALSTEYVTKYEM